MPDTTENVTTVAVALRDGARQLADCAAPLLDARVLLKCATGYDDAGLIANANLVLKHSVHNLYTAMLSRRAKGEPVAYITAEKEFWSLPFKVTKDVLIPRTDSECLIEAAVARRDRGLSMTILDLGTGSGCLVCALLSEFTNSTGIGIDQSVAALTVAKGNARLLGLGARASFLAGNWLSAFSGKADLMIANPPYIPDGERGALAPDISDFEPSSALFAGAEGFDSYEKIFESAPEFLNETGLMIIEAGDGQGEPLARLAAKAFPRAQIDTVNDLKGLPRAIIVDLVR